MQFAQREPGQPNTPGATDRVAPKGWMLGLPGDRQPDKQQLLAAAAKTTLVRFSLTVATQASGARLGVIG